MRTALPFCPRSNAACVLVLLAAWCMTPTANAWGRVKLITLPVRERVEIQLDNPHATLVEDGKVMVNVGGKGSGVVAFDAKTGEVAWQKLDATASYSSPIALGEGKGRQVVFLTQQGLASLSPGGDAFWTYPLVDELDENATTPITTGGLLVAGSIKSGSVGLDLKEEEGKPG